MESSDREVLLVSSSSVSSNQNQTDSQENRTKIEIFGKVLLCFKYVTVELTVLLYLLAFSLQETLITNLILNKTCIVHFNGTAESCQILTPEKENEIQIYANKILLWKSLLENVPSVFICLFMGHLSDRYGRKLPLIIPLVGNVLMSLTLMVNVYLYLLPPEFILLASIPKGLTGSFAVLLMAAYSYISSKTSVQDRTRRIAYLDANFLLGPICGSILSVPIFASLGYMGAFGIGGSIFALNIIYTYYWVPETLTHPGGSGGGGVLAACSICFRGIAEAIKVTFKKRENYDRALLLACTTGLVIISFTFTSFSFNFLYVEKKFSWSYNHYIGFAVIDCLSIAVGMVVILPTLLKVFQLQALGLIIIGFSSGFARYLLIGLSPYSWFMYIAAVSSGFAFVPNVILRSTISKIPSPEDLGKVFSVIASLETITPLVAAPLFTILYNSTIEIFPGLLFLVCSSLYIVALLITAPVFILHKKAYQVLSVDQKEEDNSDEET